MLILENPEAVQSSTTSELEQETRDRGIKFNLNLIEFLAQLPTTENIQNTLTLLAVFPLNKTVKVYDDDNVQTELDIRQQATKTLVEQIHAKNDELNVALWRKVKQTKVDIETDTERDIIDKKDAISRIILLQRILKDSTLIPYFEDIPWEALKYTG